MTVLDQVSALISKGRPNGFCDDCIADRLGLSVRQHANHKTRELAKTRTFKREVGECVICKSLHKIVTKAA